MWHLREGQPILATSRLSLIIPLTQRRTSSRHSREQYQTLEEHIDASGDRMMHNGGGEENFEWCVDWICHGRR